MTRKTLLVGWDSVCWEYVNPLLERGELPNLQRLIESGCHGLLQSTIPPITPAAWSSIITGKLPQKHGVYDWVWDAGGHLRVASSTDLTGTPFWRRLNVQGIRVGLVNIPLTYPATPLDGFVVAGFGAPQPPAELTYPVSLLGEIEARYGDYTPALRPEHVWDLQRSGDQRALYAAETRVQAMHVQAALYAAKKFDVGVLAINMMLFDHTNHHSPSFELVESSLRETDRQLGLLLDGFDPGDVLLISDHGARRFKGLFLLGDWLSERGYLVRKRLHGQTVQELNYLVLQYLTRGLGIRGSTEKLLRAALRNTVPHVPGAIAGAFWRSVKDRVPGAYDAYWFDPAETDGDSSLISRALNAGTIYLNINSSSSWLGRNRDQVSLALVEELRAVRDPETSQPLFRRIFESSELYGPNPPGNPPDLFVDYYDSEFGLRTAMGTGLQLRYPHFAYLADNPQVALTQYGDHAHDGVHVFSGSSFRRGVSSDPGHVVDIPATLLYLHRVPIPDDFDGHPLASALTEHYPVLSQPGDAISTHEGQGREYGELEGEQVLSHLRALGYVD